MLYRHLCWLLTLTCLLASPALAGDIPSIDAEITVADWWVIGPFMSGVREAGPDALAFDRRADGFLSPLLQPSFPSALVPGGEARWQHYSADENGMVSVDYPAVPQESMDLVTDEWGFAGGMTVGYAYATLEVTDGPKRAMLDLKYASGVTINGVPWPGDPYGLGYGMSPVLLEDGENELKIGIGSRQRFSLQFLPVEGDLIAHTQSIIAPTISRGIAPPRFIGIPLVNNTNDWLTIDGATVTDNELFSGVMLETANIPPLCVYYLTTVLKSDLAEVPLELVAENYDITINLDYGKGQLAVPISMELRDAEQSRKVTFLSGMDGSVQFYGLLPPSNFDPAREYGLILSLHGAGVEAYPNQINAYQPKNWAFVAAPTNRRRFGFDWQDWGQRDMLEVLADVKDNHRIDENRVHLTGHSMGGHGTWLNALTYPDLWASAAPSAGWTRFDLYVPMFLRKNLLYGEPKANYIWQLVMRQDDTLALAENALNLPIYALEGGADDNVPPQQPRLLYEQLRRLGYDITYEEVPGMGHWWDDPSTPGTDCVDSPALNAFWESHVRNPWPTEVSFRSHDLSTNNSAFWVEVYQQLQNHRDTVIHAELLSETTIKITTANARLIKLDPVPPGVNTVVIDGDRLKIHDPVALLDKDRQGWSVIRQNTYTRALEAGNFPQTFGPWKKLFLSPCEIVIGTQGSDEVDRWNLQLARLYAYHWWYRGNGCLNVISDEDWYDRDGWMSISTYQTILRERQLIESSGVEVIDTERHLISSQVEDSPQTGSTLMLGGADVNLAVHALFVNHEMDPRFGVLPIPQHGNRFFIKPQLFNGEDLTYKMILPNPRSYDINEDLLIIEGGTSLEAMKRLPSMMGIYSGAGFPDWMLWDDEVKLKGLGGVVGMGFFDTGWQITPELSYYNEELINRLND